MTANGVTTSAGHRSRPVTIGVLVILTVIAAPAAILVPIFGPVLPFGLAVVTGVGYLRTRQPSLLVLAVINALFTAIGVVIALTLLSASTSITDVHVAVR